MFVGGKNIINVTDITRHPSGGGSIAFNQKTGKKKKKNHVLGNSPVATLGIAAPHRSGRPIFQDILPHRLYVHISEYFISLINLRAHHDV